jgi:diguanylate cyclase
MADTPSDRGVAAALAHRDPLTGLTNRDGWDLLVADAQERVDAFGDLVAVAVIDIDDLEALMDARGSNVGNEVIRRAASALKAVSGSTDRLVRHDDHHFAVLSNNVAIAELSGHFGIFIDAMTAHGVSASVGFAAAGPDVSVVDAIAQAEAG